MRNTKSRQPSETAWRVQPVLRQPARWVEIARIDRPHAFTESGSGTDSGEYPRFRLDRQALGSPLAAGWYALHGRLVVQGDAPALPSMRVHHSGPSALAVAEWLLPEPDATGRVGSLLLLLEPVDALEFAPGAGSARFDMREFSLRRVSRGRALRMMMGRAGGLASPAGLRRWFEWAKAVRRRGLKHATDALYADYRRRNRPRHIDEYTAWIRMYDTLDERALAGCRARARTLREHGGPLISVLLRMRGTSDARLRDTLDSVLGQVWREWELCVAVDPSLPASALAMLAARAASDARVRVVECADGGAGTDPRCQALNAAGGTWIALLDAGDVLRPHSLLRVAEVVAATPELAIVYTDEDQLDTDGKRCRHHFKPDWNPDLLRSHDYTGHLVALRAALVRDAGGFRDGFAGAADHDLLLRCSERVQPTQIFHVPEILCHVRADGANAVDAAAHRRAVTEHLQRTGGAAEVLDGRGPPRTCRVRWRLPQPAPRVSVIIPTRDRGDLLRRCVESVLTRSTYPDVELVVVDNQSRERVAREYLQELARRERVHVLRDDSPFNFAAINNRAARQCGGQLLVLLNNDIEVITPDWLEEMAGFALRPDVGAVGAMLYHPGDTIQHAGMLLGLHGIAGHVYAGRPRGCAGYHGRAVLAQNLSVVTGACLMVRRDLYEAAGGLDEQFPVEFNDVDFCLRLLQRGHRNVWTPFAELYHHESASRTIADAAAQRMRAEGVARMLQRWGDLVSHDPAYNPNLSLQGVDCDPAFPPRVRRGRVVVPD